MRAQYEAVPTTHPEERMPTAADYRVTYDAGGTGPGDVGSPDTALLQARATDTSVPSGMRQLARKRSRGGHCFLLVVFTVIGFIYFTYTFTVLLPSLLYTMSKSDEDDHRYKHYFMWVILICFNTMFAIFITALIQAITTDPGAVPRHWGFYVGDEARRRRYCRVCNVWKPDRTHHCSQCGRCVLNMDHHCPWINNCVGFFNRKFFIQVLIYAIGCLLIVFSHGVYHIGEVAREHWLSDYNSLYQPVRRSTMDYIDWTFNIVLLALVSLLLAALIPFTRFHTHLIVVNLTTIESMDPTFRDHARYDLGPRRNIEQVFGGWTCLWWIPLHLYRSRPIGDGVRWRRHYLRAMDASEGP